MVTKAFEESEIIETKTGRVFEIYYNKISKDYTLKFLHPNLILYYKISNYLYFNTGKEYYLLLGNIFVTINAIIFYKSTNFKMFFNFGFASDITTF